MMISFATGCAPASPPVAAPGTDAMVAKSLHGRGEYRPLHVPKHAYRRAPPSLDVRGSPDQLVWAQWEPTRLPCRPPSRSLSLARSAPIAAWRSSAILRPVAAAVQPAALLRHEGARERGSDQRRMRCEIELIVNVKEFNQPVHLVHVVHAGVDKQLTGLLVCGGSVLRGARAVQGARAQLAAAPPGSTVASARGGDDVSCCAAPFGGSSRRCCGSTRGAAPPFGESCAVAPPAPSRRRLSHAL